MILCPVPNGSKNRQGDAVTRDMSATWKLP